jgi:hypothetical protein
VEPGSTLSKSNAELAIIAGVSQKTIQQAKAVHAGAVPAVQHAVKAGAVSVKIAAAIAKLPASTQQVIADKGYDAMRVATSARRKSVTNDSAMLPTKHRKQKEAEQNAFDAHGDSDPIAILEASEAENTQLRALLAAAEADDKQAEIIKWHRIADIAQRRQSELMETVNQRENELHRQARWLRRIGAALGEPDNSKLPILVEALAQSAKPHSGHAVFP